MSSRLKFPFSGPVVWLLPFIKASGIDGARMQNWLKLAMAIGACTLAAGCATAPTQAEIAAADYGAPISQAAAEEGAAAFVRSRLKDPDSARFEWREVQQGYFGPAPLGGKQAIFGYLLEGTVNAKNSFGGYTGAEPYQFLFRDGVLVRASHQVCMTYSCYMEPML